MAGRSARSTSGGCRIDFVVARLTTCDDAVDAIRSMLVRGAPLIGATAAYGVALAMRADGSDAALDHACQTLLATRPTAINLKWALDEMRRALRPLPSRSARRRPIRAPLGLPKKTSPSTGASASTALR